MYSKEMTNPMKAELTVVGVEDLHSSELVNRFMEKKERSAVILVNSVCGCAAGTARPAFIRSLDHPHKPLQIGTVFAGVDQNAVAKARDYFVGYAPSSPAIAFFREGELVYFLERNNIEGVDADTLSKVIGSVYDKFFQKEIQDSKILDPFSLIEVDVHQTKQQLESGEIVLLDCRTPEERKTANIEPSTLLTQELAEKIIKEWDHNKKIVIFCHHGNRSLKAANFFKNYQFNQVYSMKGGIDEWSHQIDSSVPTY